MANLRILIAAGGTGGHVYPAIAIADALKVQDKNIQILFVGTKNHMEWTAVPKAGYRILNVWVSGLQRRFTFKNLLFPVKLLTSLFQSLRILSEHKPQVVVSCGGYVAGPIGWIAAKRGLKVVIQEQNSFPGVTNRILAKFASVIFTAFKEAEKYFPAERVILSGNPTRNALDKVSFESGLKAFGFDNEKPVLMIMGGSLGAKTINDAIQANLDSLKDIQIIWQCGSRYFDKLSKEVDLESNTNIRLMAFIENMPEAYAASDLIVSRAGASSCSELMVTGKPSVLIPSPNVAGDHQTQNAQSMVSAGASVFLKDEEARNALPKLIRELIHNEEKLKQMNKAALSLAKPHAAEEIAKEILTLAKLNLN